MIPNELLKYGGLALAESTAGLYILNAIFERGEVISTIEQGVLIPLQSLAN